MGVGATQELLPIELGESFTPFDPPLKWAGGKRWLIQYLTSLWAPYRNCRLVEPFSGGLSVALNLLPEKALLNDINPHLINFYQWIKKGLFISIPMENDSDLYYAHRNFFNDLIRAGKSKIRQGAELFYYLNRTGYNGLCRFNRHGIYNVPFGQYQKINYRRDFLSYQKLFMKWEFISTDFENLILEPTDFVYADPPYDVKFTQYAEEDFGWNDQIRLIEWLSKHKGPVVISNQATDRIVDLYEKAGFRLHYLLAPRQISCKGDRSKVQEVLGVKNI
jgi:DNA adenine methylase